MYDTRLSQPVMTLSGHQSGATCVQMDDWKVVSGARDGMVCVWDQRMTARLWDAHNRCVHMLVTLYMPTRLICQPTKLICQPTTGVYIC